MLNLLKKNNRNLDQKIELNKVLFNSSTKKKIIGIAARESAEDQKRVLERYKKLVSTQS